MTLEEPILLHVETSIHGRVLVSTPSSQPAAGTLVGFHGYAENASIQLERMVQLELSDWCLCSVQALHPFYTRANGQVVSNWMTRLDRELAIRDNLAYVAEAIRRVNTCWAKTPRLVFCGFSQGAAMAYRAAVHHAGPKAGVIAVGGDIPPELDGEELGRVQSVLIARGSGDRHYPAPQMEEDLQRLSQAGIPATTFTHGGAHDWPEALTPEIRRYLLR